MSFPTYVSGTSTWINTTTIAYPAGIQAGDMLLLICPGVESFAGWTKVLNGTIDAWAKYADGTESGNLSLGASRSLKFLLCIRNGDISNTSGSQYTSLTSLDTPDPPSHTPASGADYLWIAHGFATNVNYFTSPSAPSGYTLGASENGQAVAWKQQNASSNDPGAFGDGDALTQIMYSSTFAIGYLAPTVFGSLFFGSNF
jgi:hypothetical protein